MNWLKSKKTVAVHDGSFHPDDVFSVALLSILYKGHIKVIRTRDEKELVKADYVIDVGLEYDPTRNRFDHHQEGGAGFRDDKIPFSSFGLIWKEYGKKICGSERVADILDKKIVTVIDADDCGLDLYKPVVVGVIPHMFTDTIYALRPTWKEEESKIDIFFQQAVDLAKAVLLREIKITTDLVEAESLVEEVYNNSTDKKIIIFTEKYLPKTLLYKYPEPLLIVYKERYGQNWRITTIEKSAETYESRKNFPETWWGKRDSELAKISGVVDAVFCRNGGIFAGARSKEGAIKLAEIAINNKNK